MKQVEIARIAETTQARVSQILSVLSENGLCRRTTTGWALTDPEGALDQWLADYRGPAGSAPTGTGSTLSPSRLLLL